MYGSPTNRLFGLLVNNGGKLFLNGTFTDSAFGHWDLDVLGGGRVEVGNTFCVGDHATATGTVRVVDSVFTVAASGNVLLGGNDAAAALTSGVHQDIQVADPVPLYFQYITGWATPNGTVQFRDDIYQRDGLGGLPTGDQQADAG